MKNNITIEKEQGKENFIFLIDGVYNQQKGFNSESEALKAAKEFLKNKRNIKNKA
jgi:hypothetical protein